jgi:hypothetical protein
MNMTLKLSLAGAGVIGLLIGAFALGRRASPEPAPSAKKAPAAAPQHHHEDEGCHHPPPAEPPTPEEIAKAKARFQDVVPMISRLSESGKIEQLNDLQNWLGAQLSEGKITAQEILERFRAEKDMAVLDVLMGVLKANPPVADQPEVISEFVQFATTPGDEDRRRVAIAILAGVWDRSGDVRRTLLDLARNESDLNVKLSAIVAFNEYTIRNHTIAESVNQDLLSLAGSTDATVRSVAVQSINMVEAGADTVKGIAALAADATVEVRVAAYDRLGEVRAEHRSTALSTLESAFASERDEVGMGQLVIAMVRSGRADALPALRRLSGRETPVRKEILDYIRVLETGEVDWERIVQRKAQLERQ